MSFTFSEALERLKRKEHLTRACWTLPNQWIELQAMPARGDILITAPPVFMHTNIAERRTLAPWYPTWDDLLADDWEVWELKTPPTAPISYPPLPPVQAPPLQLG